MKTENLFENGSLNSRFKQLEIPLVVRDGQTYFNISECKAVIQFCRENGIAVLGMDGFEFLGKFIIDLFDIYDASSLGRGQWDDFVNKSIEGALLFISRNNNKNEFFEFVFIESPEAPRKKPRKDFFRSRRAVLIIPALFILYILIESLAATWLLHDYDHIKSLTVNNRTFSLYKDAKGCRDNRCYMVAMCSAGYEEGCPVNVLHPFYDAQPILDLKTIFDIYELNHTLVIVVPITEHADSKFEIYRKSMYFKSTNDDCLREFYKFWGDAYYPGEYHFIVEYKNVPGPLITHGLHPITRGIDYEKHY